MFKLTSIALLAVLATTLPSAAVNIQNHAKPAPISSSDDECSYQLNYLPRVTRTFIQAIDNKSVYLVPVCEDGSHDRDDYGWLFVSGNVDTLRQPIAHNANLMSALKAEGYDQHDVVSLRQGGDGSIALYVHQRNMR